MADEKKGGELVILDHGVVTEKPKTLGTGVQIRFLHWGQILPKFAISRVWGV